MFGQVLSGGYIRESLSYIAGDGFQDFEAQIPPAAIFPIYTVDTLKGSGFYVMQPDTNVSISRSGRRPFCVMFN